MLRCEKANQRERERNNDTRSCQVRKRKEKRRTDADKHLLPTVLEENRQIPFLFSYKSFIVIQTTICIDNDILLFNLTMALNYETLIRAASKSPEQRTTTEINDFIFPWLKQSLKKKQGIFQKISDGNNSILHYAFLIKLKSLLQILFMTFVSQSC